MREPALTIPRDPQPASALIRKAQIVWVESLCPICGAYSPRSCEMIDDMGICPWVETDYEQLEPVLSLPEARKACAIAELYEAEDVVRRAMGIENGRAS